MKIGVKFGQNHLVLARSSHRFEKQSADVAHIYVVGTVIAIQTPTPLSTEIVTEIGVLKHFAQPVTSPQRAQ